MQKGELEAALTHLSRSHKVAFAASCAERLAPVYDLFSQLRDTDGRALVFDALSRVWQLCEGISDVQIGATLEALEALLAEFDEGSNDQLTAFAEDSIVALLYALRCYQEDSAEFAVFAAQRSYEAVDALVHERDEIEFSEEGAEDRILADPIIRQELGKQATDLAALTQQHRLTHAICEEMRTSSRDIGVQFVFALRGWLAI